LFKVSKMKTKYGESIIEIESKENIKLMFNKKGRLTFIKAKNFSFDNPVHKRMLLLKKHRINLILDVGANMGQYAQNIRELGYKGRIVSFEPLSAAFTELKKNANRDSLWETVNIALGEAEKNELINIAQNSVSSSLLKMLPLHLEYSPQSKYVGQEEITVRTLDSILNRYMEPGEKVYLKIDTQGYEKKVIEGASKSLKSITGIQMEMSLVPLYEGETLLADMVNFIAKKGYKLMSLEPIANESDQLLQVDSIFFRKQNFS